MLTLKEPIKLNIQSEGFTTVSEAFYERIVGNYGLLTAQITPKDLLFFLSAPPELPEDLGGMTTFAVQNTLKDSRSITMEVVNNVVNRILLSQTNDFTYQDQIYIDSVLNKLGITDVSLFMRQVQKLQSEHTDINQLLTLYRQELRLRQIAPLPEERGSAAAPPLAGSSGTEPDTAPRYFLQNDIFKRLDTKNIYDIVNSFQQEQSHFFGSFHRNELKTSEQLSVSSMLALAELREQLYQSSHMELTHAVNHFELGDMLPPPKNEEEVLSQAAAAALVSTVEHVLVQQLDRSKNSRVWLNLENSLSETIENSISRFQSYHSGNAVYLTPEADVSLSENTFYKTEAGALEKLVNLREQFYESLKASVKRQQDMGILPPAMQQLQLGDQNESTVFGDEYSTLISAPREGDTIFNPPATASGESRSDEPPVYILPGQPLPEFPELQKSFREIQLEYDVRSQQERLRDLVFLKQAPGEELPGDEDALSYAPTASSETLQSIAERVISATENAVYIKNEQNVETTIVDKSVSQYSLADEIRAQEEAERLSEPPAPVETAYPPTDSEAPPELINQETAEISRRNRERFQQIQSVRADKISETLPAPDRQRTMSDALRAISSPEAVIREVLEEQVVMDHRQQPLSPEATAYLAGADEATRSILEAVMHAEQNPAAATGGIIREASLGEFNSITAVHPPQPAEIISESQKLRRETVRLTERADAVLEQYSEAPARPLSPKAPGGPPPKVPIVHKQEQSSFSEELLERLEQRQTITPTVRETTDIETHRDIHQTEVNDISTSVVTQTTEDITQLVNSAITKQMSSISDKVYHQMEKRLQTERSRRGRF